MKETAGGKKAWEDSLYLWGNRLWENGTGEAILIKAQVPLYFLCRGFCRSFGGGTGWKRKRGGNTDGGGCG